jgi:CheY-like chemotaxis protein
LSITKKLVEMMGGKIHVHSIVGQGSVFSFDLLLPEADAAAEKPPALAAIGYARPADGRRYRILVVDDKLENRLVIINLLEPLGFEVSEAEDGLEAVEKVAAQPPDAILMDLIMPRMNGLEAISRIRQQPESAKIPILVASASAFDADRKRSLEVGATDFIAKPVQEDAMLACLQKYLGLQWEYAAPAEETAETGAVADKADEAGFTPEQAEELYALAMRGNISGIIKFLQQIEQDNPAQRGIAKRVRQLAKEFKEEEICELAEQYRNA